MTILTMKNLGRVYYEQNRHSLAKSIFENTLSLAEKQQIIPYVSACHYYLGKIYQIKGNLSFAHKHLNASLYLVIFVIRKIQTTIHTPADNHANLGQSRA